MMEEMTFSSLPHELILNILGKLKLPDKKIARLVCTDWLSFVNYDLPVVVKLTNNNTALETFINSFFGTVKALSIEGLTKKIPIYSRRRFKIPKAKELTLHPGISGENISNLFKCYVFWSQTLYLNSICLAKAQPNHLRGRIHSENITNLKIHFQIQDNTLQNSNNYRGMSQYSTDLNQHLKALTEFLSQVSVPNIASFTIYVDGDKNWPENDTIVQVSNKCLTKFAHSLEKFAKTNTTKLRLLKCRALDFSFPQSCSEHLSNVEELILYTINSKPTYGSDITGTGDNAAEKYANFKNLKTLALISCIDEDGRNTDNVASNLLSINANTLNHFEYFKHGRLVAEFTDNAEYFSLDWLYSNPGLKLSAFQFAQIIYLEEAFLRAFEINYQMEWLTNFTFILVTGIGEAEGNFWDTDWRDVIFDWVIQLAPNLQTFQLSYASKYYKPSLIDIQLMINNLPRLKYMKFVVHGLKSAVSRSVVEYFQRHTNGPISGSTSVPHSKYTINIFNTRNVKAAYEITIKRPLDPKYIGDLYPSTEPS